MPYKDVRDFIAKLGEEGEPIRIAEEVDWNLEAGAILRRSAEAGLPAVLFEKIKGYPEGFRLFGGGAASFKRMAISLDMSPDTPPKELMDEYLRRRQNPIKPVIVKDGPCKENVEIGDEVDLLKLPVPMIHGGDGGRFIGTWHATITKDPETGWMNWGMYRHMVMTKNAVGILLASPRRHFLHTYNKEYAPKNKPIPVAIAIGMEPVSALTATSPMPLGVAEVDAAGGLRGEPIELIKCETIDILVPATSEIIIEGEVKMDDTMEEGPFGEYTGYVGAIRAPRPAIRVKALTYRNNPILTFSNMGIPVDDNCSASLTRGSELLEALRQQGLPVVALNYPPECSYTLAIVSVKKTYNGVAADVAHVIWGTSSAGHNTPYIIVVQDDVDPFNIAQVFHALATKCHPIRDIHRTEQFSTEKLIPWLSQYERENQMGAAAYFDCTWPLDWDPKDVPQRVSLAESYPAEIQQKALDMWRKYGH
ncbi:UbiD family decarboxylase [Chloroflexota bacterium]